MVTTVVATVLGYMAVSASASLAVVTVRAYHLASSSDDPQFNVASVLGQWASGTAVFASTPLWLGPYVAHKIGRRKSSTTTATSN